MKPSEKLWQLVEISAQYQSLYELAMDDKEASQEDLDMIGVEAAEITNELISKFLEEYNIEDVDDDDIVIEEVKEDYSTGSKYEW